MGLIESYKVKVANQPNFVNTVNLCFGRSKEEDGK